MTVSSMLVFVCRSLLHLQIDSPRYVLSLCNSNLLNRIDSRQPANIPSYLMTAEARNSADNMLKEALGLSEDLFDLREVRDQYSCVQ